MISLTTDALMAFLKQQHLEPAFQKESGQVYYVIKVGETEFPVFLRVDPSGKILQILLFIPCAMRPKAPPEMARLLHLLNKEIDLPGFGMDESIGMIFYRMAYPTGNGKIDQTVLENLLFSLPKVCENFFPLILNVAGGVYFEAIAADIRNTFDKLANQ